MKVAETLAGTVRELEALGAAASRTEAELLLASVLGLLDAPRAALYGDPARELTTAQARTLAGLLLRRLAGEPVQYLVGRAWFRDLVLEVGPGVLVPRPETEILAGEVVAWLAAAGADRPLVLDLGTGSGCIALAVACERPGARVVASDLSTEALAWARRNRSRAETACPGAAARVALVAADGLTAFRPGPRFDVVASNPPYVSESDHASLAREIRDHEPRAALVAERGGLAALERLVDEAHAFLRPGGLLALEVGGGQADNVRARLSSRPEYGPARVVQDLAGTPRVVLAERHR